MHWNKFALWLFILALMLLVQGDRSISTPVDQYAGKEAKEVQKSMSRLIEKSRRAPASTPASIDK